MRTDNMYTNVLQLQLKQRQTRQHKSDIGTWYRVRVSTECFIKLMGLCSSYETDGLGESKLNVWAPTVLFPQSVVCVGQNKTKKERTVKKRTTKPEVIESTAVPTPGPPVVDLPLFLPIPLPSRKPKPFPTIETLQGSISEGTPGQRLSTARGHSTGFSAIIDLMAENSNPPAESSVTGAQRLIRIPEIIDLTVEDPSTQAESSTMGARRHNGKGVGAGVEVLYISD